MIKRDIAVYYQNVGGINSSIEDYRLAVSDACYDIVVLTETWLDSRTLSNQVFGSEYEVFRCDRNPSNSRKSTGGGTLVAVRSRFKARIIENELWKCLEQVWISVKLGDRTMFLCSLYIPPDRIRDNELIEAHCESVFAVMESASPIDDVFILGDFNFGSISWIPSHSGFLYPDPEHSSIHASAVILLDSYSAATLSQINSTTNENGRTLDLCFVSARDKAPFVSTAPCALVKDVPHHPPLILAFEEYHPLKFFDRPATVSYNFQKADHRSIGEVLSSIEWENVLDPRDVEAAAQTFSHVLAYVIERHVPKKIHHQDPPRVEVKY